MKSILLTRRSLFVRVSQCHGTTRRYSTTTDIKEVLHINGEDGNYKIIVPLPSEGLRMFTLSRGPIRTFLNGLKTDDPAVKDVHLFDTNDVRLASSFHTQVLVRNDFKLRINDINYLVSSTMRKKVDAGKTPQVDLHLFFDQKTKDHLSIPYSDYLKKALELGLTEEEAKKEIIELSQRGKVLYFEDNLELKDTIYLRPKDLTSAAESILNVDYLRRDIHDKTDQLELLRSELRIMQSQHDHLHARTDKTVKIVSWSIFALLTGQAILFARLVWWDLDWGIMEPVTWFASILEMTIGGYIYYLVTKREYGNSQTARMLSERKFRKLCKGHNLDLERMENVKNWIRQIEADVKRCQSKIGVIGIRT